MFTIEELSIISMFQPTTKESLENRLSNILPDIEDPLVVEYVNSTILKLKKITEKEFLSLDFKVLP